MKIDSLTRLYERFVENQSKGVAAKKVKPRVACIASRLGFLAPWIKGAGCSGDSSCSMELRTTDKVTA